MLFPISEKVWMDEDPQGLENEFDARLLPMSDFWIFLFFFAKLCFLDTFWPKHTVCNFSCKSDIKIYYTEEKISKLVGEYTFQLICSADNCVCFCLCADNNRERIWAEKGRTDPAYEVMDSRSPDRSPEVTVWITVDRYSTITNVT